jgi:hypothetical protein
MSRFFVSVTKTKREFVGNRYTTVARFKLKSQDGGPTLVYEGNAVGSEFIAKCERLKRQPITVDVSGLLPIAQEASKQSIVDIALDQVVV